MEMGYLKGEWRRFKRVIPDPRVPVAAQVDESVPMGEVSVRDISEGGLELEVQSADPAWRDQPVGLWLQLPDGARIRAHGRICHMEGNRVGIVFEQLGAADCERIRRYVESHLSEGLWVRLRRLMHSS